VVATKHEQISILDGLFERGKQNGLDGFKMLNAEEIKEYEPHVKGLKGFFVPQTGIIDYTDVCKKYLAKTQKLGGEIAFNEKVEGISTKSGISAIKTSKNT
jgi:L-2-hydroxyglutarate oxidase